MTHAVARREARVGPRPAVLRPQAVPAARVGPAALLAPQRQAGNRAVITGLAEQRPGPVQRCGCDLRTDREGTEPAVDETVQRVANMPLVVQRASRSDLLVALKAAIAAGDWHDVALRLNGFNAPDIQRLAAGLSVGQTASTRAAVIRYLAGWPHEQPILDSLDAGRADVSRIDDALEKSESDRTAAVNGLDGGMSRVDAETAAVLAEIDARSGRSAPVSRALGLPPGARPLASVLRPDGQYAFAATVGFVSTTGYSVPQGVLATEALAAQGTAAAEGVVAAQGLRMAGAAVVEGSTLARSLIVGGETILAVEAGGAVPPEHRDQFLAALPVTRPGSRRARRRARARA
ncbi:hypothetical protein [Frankia sp. Cj3]|uniref:hypothetical protein n=2 Tax=Frankia sp. Cj3 TaxID=2880976 RepID=UPI001EF72208|nr:hypothetical protein [Frankia sp. Cj3]